MDRVPAVESWIRLRQTARLGGSSGFATTTAQNGEEKATYFAGRVIISLESGKRVVVAWRRGGADNVIRFNLKFYFDRAGVARRPIAIPRFSVNRAFDQWPVNDTISPPLCD